ncbi:hypothetical protein AJ80_07894 [Polytolypa hystricis UAMH7299]|uniref:Cyclase n=1 Tax=Polytolypa hystricis (strain UAMH7299) TaxID=1447883 RepID=A0A2B7XI45_POLH7|nr:hypothetical protein AJ80_07894 [Polytolypa hystricis UAMH7299]
MAPQRPSFDELPLRKGDPPFSAWGLYGMDDQLGTLNLLTPEVIREASKEIKTGVRIGLDQPLNYIVRPSHKRLPLTHKIIHKAPRPVHDDEITMNTQVSSQWDGFRHYGYLESKLFYNGATADELSGSNSTTNLGIHSWCREGIVGRGILLDYLGWVQSQQGRSYDLLSDHDIPVADLEKCAAAQNVEIKHGDILLIRSGFSAGYAGLTEEEKVAWALNDPPRWAGVKTSIETARWIWEKGFSACAGDAPGFERVPNIGYVNEEGGLGKLCLHEVILSGWGMPIGEIFDLEKLSEECAKQGRWSFFLTSMPLNIPGGVASPPNAVAIF